MTQRLRVFASRVDHLGLWLPVAIRSLISLALGLGAVFVGLGGDPIQAALLGAGALVFALAARRSVGEALAARRFARSRRRLRRDLRPLASEGWTLAEAVPWPGGGRLDQLALDPDGRLAFAILASPFASERALERVQELASWLSLGERPCVPVVSVDQEAGGGVERDDRGVLVVGGDGVAAALADAHRAFARGMYGSCGEGARS